MNWPAIAGAVAWSSPMKLRTVAQPLVAAAVILVVAAPAFAQSAGAGDMDALVDEVRRMVDKGERERLADPWFLKDLRALIDRYDNPWRSSILDEDFSARGPAAPRPWQVMAGEFLVDWRHGLRSVVSGYRSEPEPQPQDKRSKRNDVAAAILGALVKQAISGDSQAQASASQPRGGSSSDPATRSAEPAAVAARVAIPNAFVISIDVSARPVSGVTQPRLEIGPFQGASTENGYRLIHQSGASPSFTLVSVSGQRVATVDLVDRAIDLQDNAPHTLKWSRDARGLMKISLDGTVLMQVTDRRFKDPFDGLVVVNAAGDFALRKVQIQGGR